MIRKFGIIAFGLAMACAETGAPPGKFTFSVPYTPGMRGTAYYLPGEKGVLNRRDGVCTFLGDLDVPAFRYRDPYTGKPGWRCPDVTVRHLRKAILVREGGKCLGMSCEYDLVNGMPALTTDIVDHCPDIIVTEAGGRGMQVVGYKYHSIGDNPSKYFYDGVPIAQGFDVGKERLKYCADSLYLGQLEYFDGPDMNRPGTKVYHTGLNNF